MELSHLAAWMTQAGTVLRDLPLGVHAGATVALIAGLVLWFFGSKVLKPVLAVAGAGVGGAIGAALLPGVMPAEIGGIPSHYVGLAVGVLAGVLAAMVLFRFAMAIAGGAALAVLAAMGAAAYLSFSPGALPEATAESGTYGSTGQIAERLREAADEFTKTVEMAEQPPAMAGAEAPMLTPGEQAQRALSDLWAEVRDLWSRTPDRSRFILLAAAALGGLCGLLVGQIMPNRAAAVLTSMAGSAMALSSGTWLARAFEAPFKEVLDRGPVVWLIVWAVAVALGVFVQLGGRKKSKPKEQAA